jgi:hypothetical protein
MASVRLQSVDGGVQYEDVGGRIDELESSIADLKSDLRRKGDWKPSSGGGVGGTDILLIGLASIAAAPVVIDAAGKLFDSTVESRVRRAFQSMQDDSSEGDHDHHNHHNHDEPRRGRRGRDRFELTDLISPAVSILAASVVAKSVGDESEVSLKASDAALLAGLGVALSKLP